MCLHIVNQNLQNWLTIFVVYAILVIMKLKDIVIEQLEGSEGYLSGAVLAERAGVSRNAIWKAVRELIADGYNIQASSNNGYLLKPSDVISERGISKYASIGVYEVFDEVASTNAIAKQRAADGAEEWSIIVANSQTAGRGRLGRSFYSPKDSGIYMSIILRPNTDYSNAARLTVGAAVAVARAIESVCGVTTGIKWVNDIFIGTRKCAGILTEAAGDVESGIMEFAVVGIGIDVYSPKLGFPSELEGTATGICTAIADFDLRNRLIAQVVSEYENCLGLPDSELLEKYVSLSNVIGKRVTVVSAVEEYSATVRGIDSNYKLLVDKEDGSRVALSSGEIRVKLC